MIVQFVFMYSSMATYLSCGNEFPELVIFEAHPLNVTINNIRRIARNIVVFNISRPPPINYIAKIILFIKA